MGLEGDGGGVGGREGEIEDRGKRCRETASSVVGGRDWQE